MWSVETRVPRNTIILGELWVPGGSSSEVPTALRDQSMDLRFTMFAVGTRPADAPLELIEDDSVAFGLEFARYRQWTPDDTPESLLAKIPERAEGFVLKDGNLQHWFKLKREPSVDCIVLGTNPGNGDFLGLVGSLRVGVYDGDDIVEIANVSGMTLAERKSMTAMGDGIVGRVAEVAYQVVAARGRLRHPRFICWRDDKPAPECTVDQL